MTARLSVVIPVFNEEDNLPELIDRCITTCDRLDRPFEILLVDDGSTDASRERIEAKAREWAGRVKGVFLNRNYGQHSAVICGLAHAQGEIIVTLDADLQNPPEEITRLVAKADEGYDVVGTVRIDRQDSVFRRVSSHLINALVTKSSGVLMHDYGCMLRAYSRNVVQAVLECQERSAFVPVLANGFARRTTEIDVRHDERKAGTSKYGILKLVHLMFDLMTSVTTTPLRLLTLAGGALSILGIGFALLLMFLRFALGAHWAADGVFTLFSIAFFFSGGQLIGLGLLGECIGRIHADVRARPRYFVDRTVGDFARRPEPADAPRAGSSESRIS